MPLQRYVMASRGSREALRRVGAHDTPTGAERKGVRGGLTLSLGMKTYSFGVIDTKVEREYLCTSCPCRGDAALVAVRVM